MSKINKISNPALKQTVANKTGFNLVTQNRSLSPGFEVRPLEKEEADRIHKLLFDSVQSDQVSEEEVSRHAALINKLTAEIKGIGKQGLILMGERVFEVREILKPYRNGTFTRWLESVFGSRRSGYNVLKYYELYRALPDSDLREKFKGLHQKTAYMLASRQADIRAKAEIIRDYHSLRHEELITVIQEKLPLDVEDRRKRDLNTRILSSIRDSLELIERRQSSLTQQNKKALKYIYELAGVIIANRSAAGGNKSPVE